MQSRLACLVNENMIKNQMETYYNRICTTYLFRFHICSTLTHTQHKQNHTLYNTKTRSNNVFIFASRLALRLFFPFTPFVTFFPSNCIGVFVWLVNSLNQPFNEQKELLDGSIFFKEITRFFWQCTFFLANCLRSIQQIKLMLLKNNASEMDSWWFQIVFSSKHFFFGAFWGRCYDICGITQALEL